MEINTNCLWLHHKDPYLKLGPFHCEKKLISPEIILIHNFASKNETNKVISDSKGKLSSTPLATEGSVKGSY